MAGSNKRQLTQRQWLNIIIFVTSAMFLLMVVVGQFMQRTERASGELTESSKETKLNLSKIDFGETVLVREGDNWKQTPANIQAELRVQLLGNRWLALLNNNVSPKESDLSSGRTVLLYFSNAQTPQVVKVIQRSDKLVFQFLTTNQQVELFGAKINQFFPEPSLASDKK